MRVLHKAGDPHEIERTCDSSFMDEVMPEIGAVMRKAYHFVPKTTPLYLFLDNAGGHGTKECVGNYTDMLKDEYNIILKHQQPRSPETNMLDLGAWNSFQSFVEKLHYRKRSDADALSRTIVAAWKTYFSEKVFLKIYSRWQKVLQLIIDDDGGNALVDGRKRELTVPLIFPPADYVAPTCEGEAEN